MVLERIKLVSQGTTVILIIIPLHFRNSDINVLDVVRRFEVGRVVNCSIAFLHKDDGQLG